MSFRYRNRGLQQALPQHASHKVLILEGRRAVGKSSLVRHLQDQGQYRSYRSLNDPAERARAAADPMRWLEGLARPAIVDEAQLVPDLTRAAKELVDRLPEEHQLLLTGSASVGRGTMAGSDPLVGRSTRLRLHPFTSFELTASPQRTIPSLIDLLFDAPLETSELRALTQRHLVALVRTGGMPSYCLPAIPLTRSALESRVRSDTLALLGDQLLPGERLDVGIAQAVLDAVLRIPGGQFNATRLGQGLDLDQRTVSRYVQLLERRFLLTQLHNLRAGVARASRAMPKIHATDTSATCEVLSRSGHDVADSPEALGQVLESWVVQQLMGSLGWTEVPSQLFYWRDNKTGDEVDAVLLDGTGRRVGVEVKLASAVAPKDLKGLRALRDNGGLHRGFVVHTGSAMEQLDEDIWALPLSALTDPSAWSSTPQSTTGQEIITVTAPAPDTPSVFLSYVHNDDETFDGLLVSFAEQVAKAYQTETGTSLELIVDRSSINWGERWRNRLTTELARANFLLAMVTPSYIRSKVCREEFLEFRAGEATKGHDGILALLVKDPRWNRPDVAGDPGVAQIRETMSERQWLTLEHPLEELEVGTSQFRRTAQAVAKALAKRVDAFDSAPPPAESTSEASEQDDEDGLLELQERIHDVLMPRFTARASEFDQALRELFQDFTAKFNSLPQGRPPQSSTLTSITHRLEPRRTHLDETNSALSASWRDLEKALDQVVRTATHPAAAEALPSLREELLAVLHHTEHVELETISKRVQALALMSRSLKPLSRSVEAALQTFRSIEKAAELWQQRLR
ncbi:MAG: DUF4143 domain-containing protein [Arachnia propionica]|uniref:DUF4143 domain-containing protein n=1 Tax=Arachnia propionica TaxID=1750 RepID=UPI0027010C3E|nr:DUF4143 domain-containing protein [Arachnia propionica]